MLRSEVANFFQLVAIRSYIVHDLGVFEVTLFRLCFVLRLSFCQCRICRMLQVLEINAYF